MEASSAGIFSLPKPPFRPRFIFSNALKTTSFSTLSHRSPSRPFSATRLRPFSYQTQNHISDPTLPLNPRSRTFVPLCFRCGGSGHFARSCSRYIRCYGCGNIAHKIIACPKSKLEAFGSSRFKDQAFGMKDDSFQLITSQDEATHVRDDCILSNPDVLGCLSPSTDVVWSAVAWEPSGVMDPVESKAIEEESLGCSVLADGIMESAVKGRIVGTLEHKVPGNVALYIFHSQIPFQSARLGCSSILGAVSGRRKGRGAPVVERSGQWFMPRKPLYKDLRADLAVKFWNKFSKLGLECALGSNKFNCMEDISDDYHSTLEPGPSAAHVVKEVGSSFYDFPTIEEDLSSDEESTVPISSTHEQVVLNLDQNPIDVLLGIEIIDGLSDFCSVVYSNDISPLEQAPVDGLNKKSERQTNLKPPPAVRRSLRISKVVI